jgi:hypothetical protein
MVLTIAVMIKGSLLQACAPEYKYLKERLSEDSKIRKECEQVVPAWFWRGPVETACDSVEWEFNRQALIVDSLIAMNQQCKKFNDEYKDIDENNLGWLDRAYRFGRIAYTLSVVDWYTNFIQRLERVAISEEKLHSTVNIMLAHQTEEIRNKEYESLSLLLYPKKTEKSVE